MLNVDKGHCKIDGTRAQLIAEWSVLTQHMIESKVFDNVDSVREKLDTVEKHISGDNTIDVREQLKELLSEDKMKQIDEFVNSLVDDILGR